MKDSGAVDWRGYYDAEGRHKTFHPESDPAERMRVEFVERLTAGVPFAAALDVGCGNGYLASRFAGRGGTRIAGIDFSRPRLRDGYEQYSDIRFARASATALPFADKSFDLISMVEVLEHLPEPISALAELKRVSRGHVVVTVPYRGKVIEITCPHCMQEFHYDGHIHSFDEVKLGRLAEAAGLRVVRIEPYVPFYPSKTAVVNRLPSSLQRGLRRAAVSARLAAPQPAKFLGLLAAT